MMESPEITNSNNDDFTKAISALDMLATVTGMSIGTYNNYRKLINDKYDRNNNSNEVKMVVSDKYLLERLFYFENGIKCKKIEISSPVKIFDYLRIPIIATLGRKKYAFRKHIINSSQIEKIVATFPELKEDLLADLVKNMDLFIQYGPYHKPK
jgi:hypothetical protein